MARPAGVSFTSPIAFTLSAAVLHLKLYRLYYRTGNTVGFFVCFYHSWCVAFQEKRPPVVRTQTLWQPNAKITSYAEAHLGFTLHHQQPGHKAATGNGLWSIAFQRHSLDTLRFYLKPARNWSRMSLCIVEHCIAANLPGRSVRGEPSMRPKNCI